jgi:hypothetical protein
MRFFLENNIINNNNLDNNLDNSSFNIIKMPRARRDNPNDSVLKPSDVEEDYLDVDKPLPGQNYYCISFVSPDKIIQQKELFMFYHYEQAFYKKFFTMAETALTNTINSCEDGKVDISNIVKLKKSLIGACNEEQVSWKDFKDKFESFLYRDEEKIGEAFDKANNFRTSVRGVKIRGVFDTKREADVRAAVLQRQDPLFDVFVGQVGYWCPWDPNPTKIDDVEYTNSDLNKLVKEYKANEAKKDAFYQEQKTARQKDALSAEERLKHQQGLTDMKEYQQQIKDGTATSQPNTTSLPESTDDSVSSILLDNTSIIGQSTMPVDTDSLTTIQEHVDEIPQAITQSITVNDPNAKETTVEQESAQLQGDDIWLARKLAAQQP